MTELFAALPSIPALMGQLTVGLVNGAFYAMLSLGLAVIFGILNIINFAHGAQYMLGAFTAYVLLTYFGIGYWPALFIAPVVVGLFGIILERTVLQRVYRSGHTYGLLLTFGLALTIEGAVRNYFGSAGLPYSTPEELRGGVNLGFMFLPMYRAWVIIASVLVCFGTWYAIERTRLGAYLRAATENPTMVDAFGINVPLLISLTYGVGVGLAALAGVMAAPIYQVSPQMGSIQIITVFAVIVIGGMGSIRGAIFSGFLLGLAEGLTKVFYPQASSTVIFAIMAIVLLLRPAGLFGRDREAEAGSAETSIAPQNVLSNQYLVGTLLLCAVIAPFLLYPMFLVKVLCFALFASAVNLLLGYAGLLSFGHAAYFGGAAYITAYLVKVGGLDPISGIIAGTAVATVLGLIIGWLAIRRQGIYFAMVTLAFAQMIYFIAVQAPFTGGDDGIQAVPRGHLLGLIDLNSNLAIYYFVLVIFILGVWLVNRTIHSPFGNVLTGIRENERRMRSLGYDVDHYKLLAFVISAALAGVAGSTKSIAFQLASLTDVHWAMSGEAILIAIVGGIGTVLGPILGAFVVAGIEHYLAGIGSWLTVVQGLIFVSCVLIFRQGIMGGLSRVARALSRESSHDRLRVHKMRDREIGPKAIKLMSVKSGD